MSGNQTQHAQDQTAELAAAVTVYSRQGCVQWQATHRALDRAGVTYCTVDLDDSPDAAQRLCEAGYQQLPVVQAGEKVWSGYRPDQIRGLRVC